MKRRGNCDDCVIVALYMTIAGAFLLFVVGAVANNIGYNSGRKQILDVLVKQNLGEFKLNNKTGEIDFILKIDNKNE